MSGLFYTLNETSKKDLIFLNMPNYQKSTIGGPIAKAVCLVILFLFKFIAKAY